MDDDYSHYRSLYNNNTLLFMLEFKIFITKEKIIMFEVFWTVSFMEIVNLLDNQIVIFSRNLLLVRTKPNNGYSVCFREVGFPIMGQLNARSIRRPQVNNLQILGVLDLIRILNTIFHNSENYIIHFNFLEGHSKHLFCFIEFQVEIPKSSLIQFSIFLYILCED